METKSKVFPVTHTHTNICQMNEKLGKRQNVLSLNKEEMEIHEHTKKKLKTWGEKKINLDVRLLQGLANSATVLKP